VILCHARRDPELRGLRLGATGRAFRLETAPAWRTTWPQSAHLLGEEAAAWQKTPWAFAPA
jgi:exopolyphosphatase / guanosine-5'-triphosphate,3'-diphosphate pyrophosphatase